MDLKKHRLETYKEKLTYLHRVIHKYDTTVEDVNTFQLWIA